MPQVFKLELYIYLLLFSDGGATRAGEQKWEDQIVVLGGVAEATAHGGV